MTSDDRLARRILSGRSDANIRFSELRTFLQRRGFEERIKGSHFTYRREGVPRYINIQPRGGYAKDYQVRQVRKILQEYNLLGGS